MVVRLLPCVSISLSRVSFPRPTTSNPSTACSSANTYHVGNAPEPGFVSTFLSTSSSARSCQISSPSDAHSSYTRHGCLPVSAPKDAIRLRKRLTTSVNRQRCTGMVAIRGATTKHTQFSPYSEFTVSDYPTRIWLRQHVPLLPHHYKTPSTHGTHFGCIGQVSHTAPAPILPTAVVHASTATGCRWLGAPEGHSTILPPHQCRRRC